MFVEMLRALKRLLRLWWLCCVDMESKRKARQLETRASGLKLEICELLSGSLPISSFCHSPSHSYTHHHSPPPSSPS